MNYFIIDCMGLVFRSHYAHPTLTRSDGVSSGSVYGFLVGIQALKRKHSNCHFVFAWDSGSDRKKGIYAGYKQERSSMDMGIQVSDLRAMLKGINSTHIWMAGEEADDVIASYVYQNDGLMNVYSSDKDMLQLVRDGKVVVFKPKEDTPFDEEAVNGKYGVKPEDFALYQAIRGDDIDSVPGIPRIPSKLISYLCSKYKNPIALYDGLNNEKLTPFQSESFQKFGSQINVNMQLVRLSRDLKYNLEKGSSNIEIIDKYLKLYGIGTVSAENFVSIFDKEDSFNYRESIALKTHSVF